MSQTPVLSFKQEVAAIGEVIESLQPLTVVARQRVLEYVICALGIGGSEGSRPPFGQLASLSVADVRPGETHASGPAGHAGAQTAPPGRRTGIRALKEAKRPRSANEMAAVVAYYLRELAPEPDRRETIEAADINRYFTEAGFPLPKAINMTLTNAAGSGYFDRVEQGKFRLNAVGYDLVAHSLPRATNTRRTARKGRTVRAAVVQ